MKKLYVDHKSVTIFDDVTINTASQNNDDWQSDKDNGGEEL